MNECEKRGGWFALLLIAMGVLLFLENVGLLPFWNIADFWPVWMIIWAVFIIDRSRNAIALIWSGALIVCGVLLILGNLRVLPVNAGIIWPVMLIALGLALLLAPAQMRQWTVNLRAGSEARRERFAELREQRRERFAERREYFREHIKDRIDDRMRHAGWSGWRNGNSIREDVVFSSVSRRIQTQQFEGGRVTTVFGSIQLDLLEAAMANNAARVKADAVFGGIEIIVPRAWKVEMRSAAVFGGCDDRTVPPRPELGIAPPTLTVVGSAVFGGITVRN